VLQVLEGGGMEEADAWMVLRGILAALAYIHSQVSRGLPPVLLLALHGRNLPMCLRISAVLLRVTHLQYGLRRTQ
jgi:hypothetical protein